MENEKKKKNKRNNEKGFTIIEMLIAVLIFTLSLSSLMAVSSASLKGTRDSEKHLIGSYLTIEAIELVHNLRDQAILSNDIGELDWHRVFQGGEDIFDDDGCFDGTGACNFYIDGGEPVLGNCSQCNVFFDKNADYYFQTYHDGSPGSSKKTPFSRKIYIRSGNSEDEVYVLVKTEWPGGGVSYGDNLYLYQ